MGTPFSAFAETCNALQGTWSRERKVEHAAALLDRVDPDERAPTARFLAGQVLSPLDARSLDVGPTTLEDLGDERQASLAQEPLTIRGLARAVDQLADLEGPGSASRRRAILDGLAGRVEPDQRDWLTGLLLGELRTGVQEGLVLEAIAQAADIAPSRVRRAHQLRGDVGEVAHLAIDGGEDVLVQLDIELGHPIRPMLADRAEDVTDALVELGGPLVFEHKLDGARIQIHKTPDAVHVFSRRLTDVTESLPEAVELAGELRSRRALVEGEAVAIDPETGRPQPFQEVMRRFRRVHGVEESQERVPVRVLLFDCLHLDGHTLLDAATAERWARLRQIAPAGSLVEHIVTGDPSRARTFYQEALDAGHEGVIAKDRDSGYVPGRRGRRWLKIKPHETLDLVVLAAEEGHGRREGWLSNLHLGVRVPPEQADRLVEPEERPSGPVTRHPGYAMVGKTFKGMTDEQLDAITERLQALADREEPWGVTARPELVVEVAFDEVQASPHYESGYALRFARVKAIRDDKPVEDAATLADVEALFEPAEDQPPAEDEDRGAAWDADADR